MTLLGGVIAIMALRALPRRFRGPALAGAAVALAIWVGLPALADLSDRVGRATETVSLWQQERIEAGACRYRMLAALDAYDERRLDAVAADCR